ncbi:SDR family NAD(P)-dependent oxidoreductase [Porphyromonas pogonae]|uniref:SDR family NAD(P)-dependent oxidoreductase n=1 Tax=Porphyromonas pogonae TaxID=867595 RepID=UPI002E7613DB|nr:SDR family NAD(P)-dependent oxidoreductase [Porphyromonas pogonae]
MKNDTAHHTPKASADASKLTIFIMGATSGMGKELAIRYAAEGHKLALCGRHTEQLQDIQSLYPNNVYLKKIDITQPNADTLIEGFISEMGGIDIYIHSSGVGWQNRDLDLDKELATAAVNVDGFIRSVGTAFRYFQQKGYGHLVAITSIAAYRGLGVAPAYASTKAFQARYVQSLKQLSAIRNTPINITEIKPGFVDTPLLKQDKYPLMMDKTFVAGEITKAIRKKRRHKIIDRRYVFLVRAWQLLPRCIWERWRLTN